MKLCEHCQFWTKLSNFTNAYDGGNPGNCSAPVPIWVEYLWSPRHIDRAMRSNDKAMFCPMFKDKEVAK